MLRWPAKSQDHPFVGDLFGHWAIWGPDTPEPTPGLEPGTLSLRASRGACRWWRLIAVEAAQGAFGSRRSGPLLPLLQGGVLPRVALAECGHQSACPRLTFPRKLSFALRCSHQEVLSRIWASPSSSITPTSFAQQGRPDGSLA
jgi:hypothetical protein